MRIALALLVASLALAQPKPKEQPLPFSHQNHAGTLKLPCKGCHVNPDPGEMMTFAASSKCMQCHSTVKADSPAIKKLAASAESGKPIKWVRVYEIPSYVQFSHRAHLEAGNTCAECHGKVAEREQLFKEADLSMGGCMNCHREKKASLDCLYCHDQRQ